MLNRSLTEESLVRGILDAAVPAPPKDAVARLRAAQVRHLSRVIWLVPATAGGFAAVTIGAILLSHPTYSWADVVAKATEQKQYTITLTRLMNGGKERINDYCSRDGDLWRTPATYGLKDRTVILRQHPPIMNYVLIDARKDPPDVQFSVTKILRGGVKPTVQRNVEWHGRRVDIFRLKDTYHDKTVQTFEQEVIVDPKTALPIEVTVMRDNKQWGDIWDYDFSKPDASVFVPDIHKDATVYDLVKQRTELVADLAKNPGAEFITDDELATMMLVKGDPKVPYFMSKIFMNLDGYSGVFRGVQEPFRLSSRPAEHPTTLFLGGFHWRLVEFRSSFPKAPPLQLRAGEPTVSGSIKIGDETVTFKDAKILHTGSSSSLLRSFGDAEAYTPP